MPISGTGISSKRRRGFAADESPAARRNSTSSRRAAGFSLLELLVVLVIIGIFFGAAILSMGLVDDERDVEREARRLAGVVELVQEESIMQSRDYGLLFSVDEYRFYFYDRDLQQWIETPGDELLAPRRLPPEWRLELFIDGRQILLEPADSREGVEMATPQVMILSSGEVTPFEAIVRREPDDVAVRLTAELNGTTEIGNATQRFN